MCAGDDDHLLGSSCRLLFGSTAFNLDLESLIEISSSVFLWPVSGLSWSARGIQTSAESSSVAEEEPAERRPQLSSSSSAEVSLQPCPDGGEPASIKYSAMSSLKASSRHDLAMIFTCKVCETRSVKTASRESYEKGIVVARCGGCNNLHLIADRLGWFGAPGSVEEFLAARGEEVKKGSADTLNLTLEDLAGAKSS